MKVKLEEIRVDSFATAAEPSAQRGTVNAHMQTSYTCKWSCYPKYTCPECAMP
ncbi:hypothetical protein [Longimicrobium sp.]|uniref:hypothetical protein n=1 Tax=Longimicrobium sp. TaxID=2029185 RepID=UPI002C4A7882|nr:hypothetical protein [Longimicrobium sp.]HSU15397.1 hypothetical protein [Longimicrobium sp.]